MGQLVLVRHGQASFFSDDYDKLSPLGIEQAGKLGEFWLKHQIRFDEAFSGTLQRQMKTGAVVNERYAAGGVEFPDCQFMPEFNEYDADSVMKALLPELVERDGSVARRNEAFRAAQEPREKYRTFHLLLESVMAVWVSGEYESCGFETWAQFRGRVLEGIRRVTEGRSGGKRIVVFTSGGVIGTSVAHVMQSPDRMALELNWRVHNGAVSEVAFSGGRYTLSSFNNIAHLDDPKFWTYR